MKCSNPYVRDKNGIIHSYIMDNPEYLGGIPFPCGQCLPCRINKRRIWTCRIMLELQYWNCGSFVTLTYAPEFLPKNGALSKVHLQKFFKRLRKKGLTFRYYAVGEYGDKNFRPHYHIAFFGLSVDDLPVITETWGLGKTHAGSLTSDSAQYVAGYVLKKMTKKGDSRLGGLPPEFALSSRRPAIGLIAVDDLAKTLAKHPLFLKAMDEQQNVPIALNTQGKRYPLGRYMRDKLYELFQFSDDIKPLRALRESTFLQKREAENKGLDFLTDILEKGIRTEKRINFHIQPKGRNFNVDF